MTVRDYHAGMGSAVADRTVNRRIFTEEQRNSLAHQLNLNPRDPLHDQWRNAAELSCFPLTISSDAPMQPALPLTRTEDWGDVAKRVAEGNAALVDGEQYDESTLFKHIAKGSVLMSGRHLQHTDINLRQRNQEVVTNCSTSVMSTLLFYLLLNGSGVGRSYDDDMMAIDWRKMPNVRIAIASDYPDRQKSKFEWCNETNAMVEMPMVAEHFLSLRDTLKSLPAGAKYQNYYVEDSRGGWGKAVEQVERMAFEGRSDEWLILEFTAVRDNGKPIRGMQNRPASGPGPLMDALHALARVKYLGLEPWEATMHVDHYLAQCVLVGGARRAARMATKFWKDPSIFDFITFKARNNFWTSNNSVTIDDEFRRRTSLVIDHLRTTHRDYDSMTPDELIGIAVEAHERGMISDINFHAYRVLIEIADASYHHGTGEPGIINQDKLTRDDTGITDYLDGMFAESKDFRLDNSTLGLTRELARRNSSAQYRQITNPCVTGDTWVQTSTGPKRVGDLIDVPFTARVNGANYPATGFWKTGDKEVFKITTSNGFEVRATANHKFLVETGKRPIGYRGGRPAGAPTCYHDMKWVEVGDLKKGDRIVLDDPDTENYDEDHPDFKRGWLLGEIVGDGAYNPAASYSAHLSFWGEDAESMCKLAASFVRDQPNVDGRFMGGSFNEINQAWRVGSVSLDKLCARYIEPVTKDAKDSLEKESVNFIKGFIRGMFDTDGCIQGTAAKGYSVRLSQSDLSRLKMVQRMLLRVGVLSTVYEKRREAGPNLLPDGKGGSKLYDTMACHELVISRASIEKFSHAIGSFRQCKRDQLTEVLSNRKRDLYEDDFTAPVVNIVSDGVEAVYDCTVNKVHRFSANGLVAHNCGEISLLMLGGYCVLSSVVPFHCDDDDEAEEAFRAATRSLIRVNTMDSLYGREVRRTNRIGVSLIAIHEWAYKRFGFTWHDIIDEEKSQVMWDTVARFRRAVTDEAITYSARLGLPQPHSDTTVVPAGTISKLFGLSEGAHLPSMRWYMRWVQFRNDDPLIEDYRQRGYPVRELKEYKGTTIVGFPTAPSICELGSGDWVVTAAEASPEDQYQFLRLLEKYWVDGDEGNQLSYSMKYDPKTVSFNHFLNTLVDGQFSIKCCSVMPQTDASAYEYQPEEAITRDEYDYWMSMIDAGEEDIGVEHVDCAGGACPVDFTEKV